MTRVAAFALVLVSFASPSFAQVTHIAASRTAYASYGSRQNYETQVFTTTEVGYWEADARVRGAGTNQRSSILSTSVELSNSMGSSTGGGFQGAAESTLIWDFRIDTTMRWDATYFFEYDSNWSLVPGVDSYMLTRVGDPTDYFSSIYWYGGFPNTTELSGYIDPGTYRLTLYTSNFGSSTRDRTTFALSVPAPGSSAVLGLLVLARCRSRRD